MIYILWKWTKERIVITVWGLVTSQGTVGKGEIGKEYGKKGE